MHAWIDLEQRRQDWENLTKKSPALGRCGFSTVEHDHSRQGGRRAHDTAVLVCVAPAGQAAAPIEALILEQAGIDFVPVAPGLKVAKST